MTTRKFNYRNSLKNKYVKEEWKSEYYKKHNKI